MKMKEGLVLCSLRSLRNANGLGTNERLRGRKEESPDIICFASRVNLVGQHKLGKIGEDSWLLERAKCV